MEDDTKKPDNEFSLNEKPDLPAKKFPQYLAALSVCLGAVAAGTVLGWTSNIEGVKVKGSDELSYHINDIYVSASEWEWVGSMSNLGGLAICIPIGYICDLIGRKYACLSMIIPFTLGWLLIVLAKNIGMIYAGRFFTGLAGGAFCVAAPLYTSEIAEKEIRGTLGSYFQLLLTVGILLANILGKYLDEVRIFSIICLVIPVIFGIAFFLQPETPIYLAKRGKDIEAKRALIRFRGAQYNADQELKEIKAEIDKAAQVQITIRDSLKKRSTKRAFVVCFGLMVFQQLSGINAVIFYTSDIFSASGSSISFSPTVIVGIIQVAATFLSSIVVDKFGRRILLIGSDIVMCIAGLLLAIFFTLKNRTDHDTGGIAFLPILALCLFIVAFSMGFGPIPWMIASELFPDEIKSVGGSIAATLNWLMAFLVTKFYHSLSDAVGSDTTFYIFSGISLCGTFYVFFLCPETKGKSLEQIQDELNGVKHADTKEGHDNKAYS